MTKAGLARAIMEIDAKDWLVDLEDQAQRNALNIALLKQEVAANHAAVMKNSDVRLSAIMDRFDRLDKLEEQRESKMQAAKRLWIPLGFTAILTMGGLIKIAYIDPLQASIDAMDRRLKYVEQADIRPAHSGESK